MSKSLSIAVIAVSFFAAGYLTGAGRVRRDSAPPSGCVLNPGERVQLLRYPFDGPSRVFEPTAVVDSRGRTDIRKGPSEGEPLWVVVLNKDSRLYMREIP